MRKLVTVQRIKDLEPIKGADFIEKATIQGWGVVVKKGDFKVGGLCIFFEIDSLLPIRDEFSFLLNGSSPKKIVFEGKEVTGIRLKTIKLRKTISQGLALPLTTFPDIKATVGFDYSELLNVIKYEAPIPACLSGDVVGKFPEFIHVTDEERIQNLPEYLEDYKDKSFYVTEKLDGTSSSFFNHEDFGVCGRNWQLKDTPGNTYWEIARKYNLAEVLPEGYCIQGEIVGEGIQKNKYKIHGHELFVFYVYDIAKAHYLPLNEMQEFVSKLGLKMVPIIAIDFKLSIPMPDILDIANASSMLNENQRREGLVFRLNNTTEKISFKAISNNFLLKDDD